MGGKNPLVILADADLPLAVESALFGAFASTGQRCTATSRVIIEEKVADTFVAMLVERTRKFKVGNGLEPSVDMGPSVDENQFQTVLRYIEIGKKEARLVLGGERLTGAAYDRGYFVAPTIFDHVSVGSAIAQDEIFGPVLSVIRVRDFDEALAAANSVRYGLSSSLYTNDAAKIFEFIDKIETGITHINSPTVGGEAQFPFGGVKATGVGLREQGRVAIDFFTELKTVYIDYTGRKRESNIYSASRNTMAKSLSTPRVVVSSASVRLASAFSFAVGSLLILASAYLGWSWLMLRVEAGEWSRLEQHTWEVRELYIRSDLAGICAIATQFLAAWILPHRLRRESTPAANPLSDDSLTYPARLEVWERVAQGWNRFSIRLAFTTLLAVALITIHVLVGAIFYRAVQ